MATVLGQAQTPDPNFHIYLAFGQSNMEGQKWGTDNKVSFDDNVMLPVQYKQNVDPRFQVMTAVSGTYRLANGTSQQRTQGQWYTAVPPLARYNLGLSPADHFGRTLVAGIPNPNVKVGVIIVAVAGSAIEGFEKGDGANNYFNSRTGQDAYMKGFAAHYNNNPYNRLVTLAQEAQKVGVIKGIIMHQGESGAVSGDTTVWKTKVKGIYDNLLNDLKLAPNSIPILAGQAYGNNNKNISTLPNAIPGNLPGTTNKIAHIISADGCASGGDDLHFSYEGYKKLGERYGQKMLELLYSEPLTGFVLTTSANDADGGTISRDPNPASGRYDEGDDVTLTAVAKEGWKFDGWSGDATGNSESVSIKMDKDKSVTAKFILTGVGTENLVRNGNFANTQLWTLNTGSGYGNSEGSYEPANGKAVITITKTGTQVWEPQLVQTGISLKQGRKYRLTFDASAAAPREMEVLLQSPLADLNYLDYLNAGGSFALTTEPKSFVFEFEMTAESDINAQLAFNVGHSTQTVSISNVQLVYIAQFTDLTAVSEIASETDSQLRVSVLPNSSVNVNFTATSGGETELRLYSLSGRLIASDRLYTFAGKSYSHTFDRGKLPGGVYVVWLNRNGNVEQAKVVVPN